MAFDFDKLQLSELKILLGNIRLGTENLRHCLSHKQFYALLRIVPIESHKRKKLRNELPKEKGNLITALNCIITSVLGAWLGFTSFIGVRKDSLVQFYIVIALVLILSLFVSYKSFQLTTMKKRNAFYTIRLMSIELYILKMLMKKNKEKIQTTLKDIEIRYNLIRLDKEIDWSAEKYIFSNLSAFRSFVKEVEVLNEHKHYSGKVYQLMNQKVKEDVEKVNLLIMDLSNNLEEKYFDKEEPSGVNPKEEAEQILIRPIHISSPSLTMMEWIKKNYLSLIVGVIPLILGSFASMFVLLTGGPDLAKELGFSGIVHYLTRPEIKLIQFTIALLLTSSYGFFFLYDNYQAYKHNSQVELIKKTIARQEKKVTFIETKIQLLNRIQSLLENIFIREELGSLRRSTPKFEEEIPVPS